MHKKGFSMMEIIISMMLIAIVLIGLASLFLGSKRLILHSQSRMASGELGKVFLDPLHMQVRQDTWDGASNNLTIGYYRSTNNPFPAYGGYAVASWLSEPSLGGITYYPAYTVEDVGGNTNLRRATFTIGWVEPSAQ